MQLISSLIIVSIVSAIALGVDLEVILLVMAVGSSVFSFSCFLKIYKYSKSLQGFPNNFSRGVSYQLFGEAIAMAVMSVFALAEMTGHILNWSYNSKFVVRFMMFYITFITTLNLKRLVS